MRSTIAPAGGPVLQRAPDSRWNGPFHRSVPEPSGAPRNQSPCKADWSRMSASPPGPIFVYSPATSVGSQAHGPNWASVPVTPTSWETGIGTPIPPPTDPAAWLTCHRTEVPASAASAPFRGTRCAVSAASCTPFSNRTADSPPCRAPRHPSSFVGFDRNQPLQKSVHCFRPIELRNCPFLRFVVKLKLVYRPPTWRRPFDSAGGWKGLPSRGYMHSSPDGCGAETAQGEGRGHQPLDSLLSICENGGCV